MNFTKRANRFLLMGLLLFGGLILFLSVPATDKFRECYSAEDGAGNRIVSENICIIGSIKCRYLKPAHRYFSGEIRIGDFVCTIDENYPLPMNMLEYDNSVFVFGLFGTRHGGSIVSLLDSDEEMIIGKYDSQNNEIILEYNVGSERRLLHLCAGC